jgi:hypothetical protein
MGLEARCEGILGPERSLGRAQLETTELTFRGDFRARVPLADIERVDVDGDSLVVRWPAARSPLRLRLGAAAARWAERIRHPPSRLDKLGVKPTSRAAVVGPVDGAFVAELGERAAAVASGTARGPVDLIFYAVATRADLARVRALIPRMEPDGAVWIIRPKGSAAVGERDVRAAAHAAGLVGVKVAAFSATHTADKFVIPVAARRKDAPAATARPTTRTAKNLPGDRSRTAPARTRRRRAPASAPRA